MDFTTVILSVLAYALALVLMYRPAKATLSEQGIANHAMVRILIGLSVVGIALSIWLTRSADYGYKQYFYMIFAGLLLMAAEVDRRTQLIPPRVHVYLLALSIVALLVFPEMRTLGQCLGVIVVSLPMLLLSLVIDGAFGGGDIKLTFAYGLFLGWKDSLVAVILAIFLGGFYGIYVLAAKKLTRKEQFAFGPFLAIGAIVAALYGTQIRDWYWNYMLF